MSNIVTENISQRKGDIEMKKVLTAGIVVTAIALLVLPVMARNNQFRGGTGGGMGPGMGPCMNPGMSSARGMMQHPLLNAPWERIEGIAHEIGMSDKQIESLQGIRYEYRHTINPLRDQVRDSRLDLRDLVAAGDETSKTKAYNLAETIGDLHTQLMKKNIDLHFKVQNLLTQEQKDALRAKMKEMREQRQERWGARGQIKQQRFRGDIPEEE